MKLKGEKKEFGNLGGVAQQFSVDTESSMIIRLLRDKMYKNKIAAVCREIASNGRDANREAGRGDVPIQISIEQGQGDILSDDETYITFHDNGIGIAPSRMEKIFLKYGGSTKRDSDEYTGGFGIGAKTPFAYTDNFFITTVADVDGKRIKYTYQAAITSDGGSEASQMVQLGEEETNEKTGTKIQVPINRNDSNHFNKEIIYATAFWSTKPILKGFTMESEIEVVHDGKANFTVIKDVKKLYGESTYFIALVDEIPYALDMNQLKNAQSMMGSSQGRYTNNGFITVFKFETADITVSGSREDIEYVEDNVKAFMEANSKMQSEVKGMINTYLNGADTYYDRCTRANEIMVNGGNYFRMTKTIDDKITFLGKLATTVGLGKDDIYGTYKGDKIVDKHSFSMHSLDIFKTQNNGKMVKTGSLNSCNYGDDGFSLPIYFLDLAKSEPARNARLKMLHPDGYVLIKETKVEEGLGARTTQQEERITLEQSQLKLIGLEGKWKVYTEVEKLRKESGATRNITDIVQVPCRYLSHMNAWNKEWVGVKPKYDKKQHEFIELIEEVRKVKATVNEVAYFEVEKLGDLSGSGYSCPSGMTKDQETIHNILVSENVMVLAVSKSKAPNFVKAKIKSMEELFVEKMKAKSKDDLLVKAIDFSFAKSNKVNKIYFEIDFGKENNKAIKPLKDLLEYARLNENAMNRTMKIVSNISNEFAEKYKVGVSDAVKKSISTLKTIQSANPLVAFIVEMEVANRKNAGANKQLKELFKNQK